MANGGQSITLKTAEFTPNLTRTINSDPQIPFNTPSEVNLGTLNNMMFDLRCILRTDSSSDMALAPQLLKLISTNGYKFLWYDYASATTEDNNGQLIYQIASNSMFGHVFTAGEIAYWSVNVTAAFYHLHVHFFDIQPRHSGNSKLITYSMKGIVLPVKTSSI